MVYLDYNATTPMHGDVRAAYVEAFEAFGNPSSIQHPSGQKARDLLEESRQLVADSLGVSKTEIIFTSGATEAALISILGLAANKSKPGGLLTSRVEHNAVLEASRFASSITDREIGFVEIEPNGQPNLDSLREKLVARPLLASLMAVNNETGVITPIDEVFELTSANGVPLVSDLTQAAGKLPLQRLVENIDIGFMSAHKFYGPKGVGIIVAKRSIQNQIKEIMAGGGQERNIRGGTQNLPAIFATAVALGIATSELESSKQHQLMLRNAFIEELNKRLERPTVFAADSNVVENTVCLSFSGIDGDMLIANLPELEFSTGSACNSAVPEPSHVFTNCRESAFNASDWVRFSFGIPTTKVDVEFAAAKISQAVERLRGLGVSPNAI